MEFFLTLLKKGTKDVPPNPSAEGKSSILLSSYGPYTSVSAQYKLHLTWG